MIVPRVSEILDRAAGQLPWFLEVLKELQPLILLSSFSLVVATFATPISTTAAGYAIAASMAFLSGFVSMMLVRISAAVVKDFSPTPMVLLGYASVGSGIVLLYFVPTELGKAIPGLRSLGAWGSVVFNVLLVVWLTDIFLGAYRRQKAQVRAKRWVWLAYGMAVIGWVMMGAQSITEALEPGLREATVPIAFLGGVLVVAGILGVVMSSSPVTGRQSERATESTGDVQKGQE